MPGSMLIFKGGRMAGSRRRMSMGEKVLFALLAIAATALLAIAAHESKQSSRVEAVGLTQEQRQEIVGRWYAEIYPAYAIQRRQRP